MRLVGDHHGDTLIAANHFASSLLDLRHHEEARALLRKTVPLARRVLGDSNQVTLTLRWNYSVALCRNGDGTEDDLREAVMMLEETERTARRVFGAAHPTVIEMEQAKIYLRAALAAREAYAVQDAVCVTDK